MAASSFRSRFAACLTAGLLLLSPTVALAHSVYIFAWPEAGRICTESYFSKRSKVRNGEVHMENGNGNVLGSARTNAAGSVCFDPPEQVEDLRFVVLAGQGHRGEFILPASAVAEAAAYSMPIAPGSDAPAQDYAVPAGRASAEPPAADNAKPAKSVRIETAPSPAPAGSHDHNPGEADILNESANVRITPAAIRAIVREEMQRELAPLHRALAAAEQPAEPSAREIIGGLGWIVGLAGLGAFYASRRKRG